MEQGSTTTTSTSERLLHTGLHVSSGSSISWHDLKVSAGTKKILRGTSDEGLTGSLGGGEFCAIMGPSGSGKTTLLNTLAGRIENVEGTVLHGGRALSRAQLRGRIAYVTQEDILCGTQTVREALMFSAMLRLPRAVSLEEKKAVVDRMLKELRLEKCADTLIGDKMIRGVSGGEKKRVSIGVELVTGPQVLFLDEPTSGLDAFGAWSIVNNLTELSRSGCTILCTIHQPSSEVFHLFQQVLILNAGCNFYRGAANNLTSSLALCGHPCPGNTNPADHVMFLIQTLPADQLDEIVRKLEKDAPALRAPVLDASPESAAAPAGAGFVGQLLCLAKREKDLLLRDTVGLIAMVLAPALLNLLFAFIFFQAGDQSRATYSMNTHFGAITQIAIGGMFGAAQPLLLKFPLEAALFKREYATRTYSAATYFLSKTVVELPKSFLVSTITWLSCYWLMGLQGNILYYILALWLTGTAASSTALVVGCLSSNTEVALQSAPAIFVPQILFAGFFIQSNQIPVALRWVQYICSLKYGINLLLVAEFGPAVTDGWDLRDSLTNVTYREEAAALLKSEGINPDDWWVNGAALLGIIVAFRFISILALSRRANKSD